eukprot:1040059-Pelagomonas_calceolata.AAC.13
MSWFSTRAADQSCVDHRLSQREKLVTSRNHQHKKNLKALEGGPVQEKHSAGRAAGGAPRAWTADAHLQVHLNPQSTQPT